MKAVKGGYNQYTSWFGHPEARQTIADIYSPRFNRTINPVKEIMITNGANASINCLCQALWSELGDEVIVIEPFFAQYIGHIQLGKGIKSWIKKWSFN